MYVSVFLYVGPYTDAYFNTHTNTYRYADTHLYTYTVIYLYTYIKGYIAIQYTHILWYMRTRTLCSIASVCLLC